MLMNDTVNELYKAFDLFNKEYYEGKLPEPVITIMAAGRQAAFGWFTPYYSWQDQKGEVKNVEINISAEYLNRPFLEVMRTLHHEMIHLYCYQNGIKETSRRGRYHNAKFKDESEKRGFRYEITDPDKRIGWSQSLLKEETIKTIESWGLNEGVFKLARVAQEKKKKDQPKYKYTCPSCDSKFTIKKQLNITCTDCEEEYEMEVQ